MHVLGRQEADGEGDFLSHDSYSKRLYGEKAFGKKGWILHLSVPNIGSKGTKSHCKANCCSVPASGSLRGPAPFKSHMETPGAPQKHQPEHSICAPHMCAPKCSLTPQSHARLGRCQSIPTSLAWPPFNLCMCLIPRAGVSLLYHFSQAVSPESLHRASTCHTYLGPTPARAVIRHFPCPTCSCEHSCY